MKRWLSCMRVSGERLQKGSENFSPFDWETSIWKGQHTVVVFNALVLIGRLRSSFTQEQVYSQVKVNSVTFPPFNKEIPCYVRT